jgi:cysteinyl-tRNA synthetase
VKALGNLEPTHQPRATEFISQMIDMISTLITKRHAYVAGGEVLFDVTSMKDYGQLSNRKLEDQQAGARVAVETHKKNPGDFVLWKLSSAEEPGWESPWGRGRPGWHIECSAMSKQYLGEVFDIHGGGLDLIFPHHENEIAQSRCAHDTKLMANVWMHNGFLQVEGKKMSKSDGNFVTIADVLKDWPGEVARLNMLKTHYRQPIDWTLASLEESKKMLEKWERKAQAAENVPPLVRDDIIDVLSDDLNTSGLIAAMHRLEAAGQAQDLWATLVFLGLNRTHDPNNLLPDEAGIDNAIESALVKQLIGFRLAARDAKDWKESDRIRDKLIAMGVEVNDGKAKEVKR